MKVIKTAIFGDDKEIDVSLEELFTETPIIIIGNKEYSIDSEELEDVCKDILSILKEYE